MIHQIGGELLFGWNTAYVCLAHGGIKPKLHAHDIIFEVILIEILPNNAATYRPFS